MVRLKHFDEADTARFITFSCFRYHRLLVESETCQVVGAEIEAIRKKHHLVVLGYVLMPNHLHLVVAPEQPVELGRVIGELKWGSSHKIIERWKRLNPQALARLEVKRNNRKGYSFWQRRCYDHNCRNVKSVREKINYCHMNPVKAGLVNDPRDWAWSSYRWYQGDCSGMVTITEIKL